MDRNLSKEAPTTCAKCENAITIPRGTACWPMDRIVDKDGKPAFCPYERAKAKRGRRCAMEHKQSELANLYARHKLNMRRLGLEYVGQ